MDDIKQIIAARLKEARIKAGLSQEEVGAKLGYKSSGTISQHENGSKTPPAKDLPLFAKLYGVTIGWLYGNDTNTTPVPTFSGQRIPLLGRIRCGIPLLDESNYTEIIETPDNIRADFAATAEGDSMIYAGIQSGDIVLFRENQNPYNGQVVATRHINEDWGVNLKYFIQKNGKSFLRSAHPEYEDVELNGHQQIIGIMVGLIRDGAPSLSDYKAMLSIKSDSEGRWTKTVEMAVAYGITPEAIQNMINMHVTMASTLLNQKK